MNDWLWKSVQETGKMNFYVMSLAEAFGLY